MNDLTTRHNGTALSTDLANRLLAGIAQSRAATPVVGGKPLLRMQKSGEWCFGQTNDDVQDGSRWAVNIMSIAHGWVCWVDGGEREKNSMAGEVMASVTEPRPPQPDDIGKFPYKDQRSFDLLCLDGDDKGMEVAHKVTSLGGLKAVDSLLASIQAQLRHDPAHPCPVVVLERDYYDHSKWGRIYVPVYRIVDWCSLDGAELATARKAAVVQPKDEPPPKPAKAAVKPSLVERPALQPEPVATAQLHTGQRRRPAVR